MVIEFASTHQWMATILLVLGGIVFFATVLKAAVLAIVAMTPTKKMIWSLLNFIRLWTWSLSTFSLWLTILRRNLTYDRVHSVSSLHSCS